MQRVGLSLCPGIEPMHLVLEAQNLNHWSNREVSTGFFVSHVAMHEEPAMSGWGMRCGHRFLEAAHRLLIEIGATLFFFYRVDFSSITGSAHKTQPSSLLCGRARDTHHSSAHLPAIKLSQKPSFWLNKKFGWHLCNVHPLLPWSCVYPKRDECISPQMPLRKFQDGELKGISGEN